MGSTPARQSSGRKRGGVQVSSSMFQLHVLASCCRRPERSLPGPGARPGKRCIHRFLGRPRGRKVYSSPSCSAVRCGRLSSPKGRPRWSERRTASNSRSVCGCWTHASQFRGRLTGQSASTGSSSPHAPWYKWPRPTVWRCQRRTWVVVKRCLNAPNSPSRSGHNRICRCSASSSKPEFASGSGLP